MSMLTTPEMMALPRWALNCTQHAGGGNASLQGELLGWVEAEASGLAKAAGGVLSPSSMGNWKVPASLGINGLLMFSAILGYI